LLTHSAHQALHSTLHLTQRDHKMNAILDNFMQEFMRLKDTAYFNT